MGKPLADLPCVACGADTPRLSARAARALASRLPGWVLDDDATRIGRDYAFSDFASAFSFVQRVAAVAEEADHHPDIAFGWGYVRLSLHTHSIGGLHQNDFIVAARCDAYGRGSKTE